ncbi:MAG: glycoside hydrolase family 99-like domain-containing protein [Elusimicrobiota bacterium]|jgi:hypothetical protein|nr:glycoside hydrolase family 99-like domain-containing protein [Elusimicrobiota bacterium]
MSDDLIKLIAFYLPQFHPIKENDEWWGRGFTEWTNVAKAKPLAKWHYQPHIPIDVSFYDLRILDIMRRQIELAKQYGLYGFCFHYYWFSGGKRLLELPIFNYLNNKDLNFPFCLCWANEPWSRRWDGSEKDILMPQEISKRDYSLFIKDIEQFFTDSRYITIENKPVLVIYRPNLWQADIIKEMTDYWRKYFYDKYKRELYIAGAMSFGFGSQSEDRGLDAMIEFPPFGMNNTRINAILRLYYKILGFKGTIYDMNKCSIKRGDEKRAVLKGIFPSWDNTPRKGNRAFIYKNTSPLKYQQLLEEIIRITKEKNSKNEQMIFINAWNEWGEGAHLEPCIKYDYQFLEATKRAIKNAYNYDEKGYQEFLNHLKIDDTVRGGGGIVP